MPSEPRLRRWRRAARYVNPIHWAREAMHAWRNKRERKDSLDPYGKFTISWRNRLRESVEEELEQMPAFSDLLVGNANLHDSIRERRREMERLVPGAELHALRQRSLMALEHVTHESDVRIQGMRNRYLQPFARQAAAIAAVKWVRNRTYSDADQNKMGQLEMLQSILVIPGGDAGYRLSPEQIRSSAEYQTALDSVARVVGDRRGRKFLDYFYTFYWNMVRED